MITNVSGQIRYQYNDHERFLGPLITGNVHRAHDHIHDLQKLTQSAASQLSPVFHNGLKSQTKTPAFIIVYQYFTLV